MTWRWSLPLWVKLAVLASLGVVLTHSVHLAASSYLFGNPLAVERESLGRSLARLVANQATEAVLADDRIALHWLATSTISDKGVAFCVIVRDGVVLASSLPLPLPRRFLKARAAGDIAPLVIVSHGKRYLDIREPILASSAGEVRIGIDLGILDSARREVASVLGMMALGLTVAGLIAAFVVGRIVARPIGALLNVADHYDPSGDVRLVEPKGSVEFRELTDRFNRMMIRLRAAHEEQTRARQQHAATERMVALGSLVASVAHEVNNPLAGIKNCLRRLQRDDMRGEAKRQEYLALMEEALVRIEEVMLGLLDFARPPSPELRETRALDIVREGAGLLRPLLNRRQIRLREQADDTIVLADRRQAGQALLNLLLNASYVTADGGEIRVRVRHRPGFCGIAVEDDGPGIPPEIRDRVLDPFFSTKPEGEGTGLGLSVTKSILDAHGGALELEFPDRGTVATLWLRVP